jgi:hypothetical protein
MEEAPASLRGLLPSPLPPRSVASSILSYLFEPQSCANNYRTNTEKHTTITTAVPLCFPCQRRRSIHHVLEVTAASGIARTYRDVVQPDSHKVATWPLITLACAARRTSLPVQQAANGAHQRSAALNEARNRPCCPPCQRGNALLSPSSSPHEKQRRES